MATIDLKPITAAVRRYNETHRKMKAASEKRRALPPGSTRARVTTANARWSIAFEAHDRAHGELLELLGGVLFHNLSVRGVAALLPVKGSAA